MIKKMKLSQIWSNVGMQLALIDEQKKTACHKVKLNLEDLENGLEELLSCIVAVVDGDDSYEGDMLSQYSVFFGVEIEVER